MSILTWVCSCEKQDRATSEKKTKKKLECTVVDWQHENLFIVSLQMWLRRHRRAAILICWSGSTLHFLTCQHGQAKHRAFWHWHFTSLILTDKSNRKEAWHGVIPTAPPRQPMCCAYSVRSRSARPMTVAFPPGKGRKISRFGVRALSKYCHYLSLIFLMRGAGWFFLFFPSVFVFLFKRQSHILSQCCSWEKGNTWLQIKVIICKEK